MTSSTAAPWVLVLAAGEGSRVRTLTRDRWGRNAPKQFASAGGDLSLLGETLFRAERIAPAERIVTVVAAQHEQWWSSELSDVPAENIVVQPANRGTAAGILLPLLSITRQDRDATVIILPSDHFVECEETLAGSLERAVAAVMRSEAQLVLLGVRADGPEEECGWIVPCPGPVNCPLQVASFREKPDTCTAAELLSQGALLNTFIMVAYGKTLVALFNERTPRLWKLFEEALVSTGTESRNRAQLGELYHSIPSLDFSKDVLEEAAENLWVCPVPS